MRIILDYRPALRRRTGVGEYVHQIARALHAAYPSDEVTLFSSSWAHRVERAAVNGLRVADRRVPVRLLNSLWHRWEWPPVEALTRDVYDVAHSLHPLLMPTREAAQVVTVHDLDFLDHPERTQREIRRDYPARAADHAHRAHHVIVPSPYTGREVQRRLGVPPERITVCSPAVPDWTAASGAAHAPTDEAAAADAQRDAYLLFVGTLEPRKNVGRLLDAYELLVTHAFPRLPRLVIAGGAEAGADVWLRRIGQPPLAGRVEYVGYVADPHRQKLFEGARLLVVPSLEEGFGMPALEAMSLGIPVVAASRGALPELVGDGGLLVDPESPEAIADGIVQLLTDETLAARASDAGRHRAAPFTWAASARRLREAYERAMRERDRRRGSGF